MILTHYSNNGKGGKWYIGIKDAVDAGLDEKYKFVKFNPETKELFFLCYDEKGARSISGDMLTRGFSFIHHDMVEHLEPAISDLRAKTRYRLIHEKTDENLRGEKFSVDMYSKETISTYNNVDDKHPISHPLDCSIDFQRIVNFLEEAKYNSTELLNLIGGESDKKSRAIANVYREEIKEANDIIEMINGEER